MFQPNAVFYVAILIHACLFEAAAWYLLWYYGNTWSTWIISAVLFAISQMQHGWLQHDILHGSLFRSRKLNHLLNDISLGLLQASILGLNCKPLLSLFNLLFFLHFIPTCDRGCLLTGGMEDTLGITQSPMW